MTVPPPPRTCVTCLHYDPETKARITIWSASFRRATNPPQLESGLYDVGGVCRAPQAIDLVTGEPDLLAAGDRRSSLGRCGYDAAWWEGRG